jgi:hypothetical protein
MAHLPGFLVPWRLAAPAGMPYTTTVLGGTADLGSVGIRIVSFLWLLAALAFVVILQCGSTWVVLGHLQKGSVQVAAGQHLDQGQRLGRVGNTGNTGEPHLHIRAQRPGTADAPLSGSPLPIRFGDRYPVRNARIKV